MATADFSYELGVALRDNLSLLPLIKKFGVKRSQEWLLSYSSILGAESFRALSAAIAATPHRC